MGYRALQDPVPTLGLPSHQGPLRPEAQAHTKFQPASGLSAGSSPSSSPSWLRALLILRSSESPSWPPYPQGTYQSLVR